MERTTKLAGIFAVATILVRSLQATTITGALAFTGQVTYNGSSPGNSSQVTAWNSVYVSSDSGTFAASSPFGIKTGPAALVAFASGPWSFSTDGPINSFWSVGGFTFQLLSSFVVAQGGSPGVNGFVVVDGTGIVSGHGYTPTIMSWSFSSSDLGTGSQRQWTFDSTANNTSSVPDNGVTAMMLGLALSGIAWMKKKIAA